MHRFNVLRRGQGEVCETLNHDQVHDRQPTLTQACFAHRSEHHHLFVSARPTFSVADLRADSSGKWPCQALTDAEQGIRFRPCGKREAEKATIDVSVEKRTGSEPSALHPPGTAGNAPGSHGRRASSGGRRGPWRDGTDGSTAGTA